MMYANKMAVAIKSSGKVLREFKDTVMVPFGSEYSVYVKNLNSVRAIVNISIDGTDVCPDGLVVNGNSDIDIERFIKDGNLSAGNRFKFIERTAGIEKHKGIGVEDGLIRISYQFEKVIQPVPYTGHWEWKPGHGQFWNSTPYFTNVVASSGGMRRGVSGEVGGSLLSANSVNCSAVGSLASVSLNNVTTSAPVNDVGITVPGSVSDQKFRTVSSFLTESEEHVIVLKIIGETESGKAILAPVTVKAKAKCVTCNTTNKATAKFCRECGTALEIV